MCLQSYRKTRSNCVLLDLLFFFSLGIGVIPHNLEGSFPKNVSF